MPRKEINDYIFYKIVCLDKDLDLCYVGSTANWKQRVIGHKYNATVEKSSQYNIKLYQTIRENGGWDNFKMIQLGTREQLKKREAEQIEEEYRVELRANMNTIKCFTTDTKQEQKKEWRDNNKDRVAEYMKLYRQENKDKIALQTKKYYNDNKDEILDKKYKYDKIKVECECGCVINKICLTRHRKTPKHLKLINTN